MARHTLDGGKYSAQELAERIVRAFGGGGGPRLPLILSLAAMAILLMVGGILLRDRLRSGRGGNDPTPTPSPTVTAIPTATPALPDTGDYTLEELEKVFELVIVGDSIHTFTGEEAWFQGQSFARVGMGQVANRSFDGSAAHWYSAEDGHEFALHSWGDLSFLPYMKNLTVLTLVQVEGTLPDLSGLKKLNCVELFDCAINDISGVSGTSLMYFGYSGGAMDLSPLNGCKQLDEADFSFYGSADLDLGGFGPAKLRRLIMEGQGDERSIDLSAMKACRQLERVRFSRLPLADLSCLSGTTLLGNLSLNDLPFLTSLDGLKNQNRALLGTVNIDNCFALRDLSALSGCTGLGEFTMEDCPVEDLSFLAGCKSLKTLELRNINSLRSFHGLEDHRSLWSVRGNALRFLTDISTLSSCVGLKKLHLQACDSLGDVSPVVKLPQLQYLMLFGSALKNVNFLWDVENKDYFSFGIAEVDDWSGLAAIEKYADLNITDRNGSSLPYLQNATVTNFELYNRYAMGNVSEGLDVTKLPHVTNYLFLHCVRSLEGLDQPDVRLLSLEDCPFLTSLSGVENMPKLAQLEVFNCPRLTDWSALNGMRLEEITLEALFTLPDFSQISVRDINLTTIYDLKDLSCFAGYNREFYRISLLDVDGVTDLSPLYHVKGTSLKVPAHLKDQAQAMVDSGLLESYEVIYPDGGWQPVEPHIELGSLEEIDTLPSALLGRIRTLTLAGDTIVPAEGAHVEEDYSTYPPALYIRYDEEEERIPVEPGTLTDLTCLEKLTGLEGLSLYTQPELTSLDGIQALGELRRLTVYQADVLTDASAAFTVQSLEELSLRFTAVSSLQGVQNLVALRRLDVNDSPVTDLSPLTACPALEEVNFFLPMMTFEELQAQPELVRQNIRSLTIAGNYVFDGSPWWVEEDWIIDPPRLYLHSNETDERLPLTEGAVTDMGELVALLPNLENLDLYGQQLTTLDGIEGLERLRDIHIEECRGITDFFALWRADALESINLRNEPISGIEGIESMKHLIGLQLSGTAVKDFSPLTRVDYSYCTSEDFYGWGFNLALDVTGSDRLTYENYDALEAVPVYWSLNMNGVPVDRWLDHIMGKEMHELSCHSCGIRNEQLRAFVEAHPELSQLDLRRNPQLTDLSCLLGLKELRQIWVSGDMPEAIASLGEGYGFELNIE